MGKTYREQFEEALACTTSEEANEWLADEIDRYAAEFDKGRDEAAKIIKANLGYMAGYYDGETAKKIHALFGAEHPIFGGSDYHETVTPEQAFEAGKKPAGA